MKTPSLPPLLLMKSPSGYYVYKYKNKWDEKKKRSVRTETVKVGSILGGGKEGKIRWDQAFIDEHPELEHFSCERKGKEYAFTEIDSDGLTLPQALKVQKLSAGATWALDQIVASSPIGSALKKVFSDHRDYLKILSLAYFIILSQNNNVSRYEEFSEVTRLPWPHTMSSSTIFRLFNRITAQKAEEFLRALEEGWVKLKTAQGQQGDLVLALDSTSISSYSKKLADVERGRNKDEEDLPQINILMLVDPQMGLPIFYRHYAGNVPDVATLRRVIADNARMNLENVMLVSDKGYSSSKNIEDCLRNNVSFIFNMKCGVKGSLVQELIDQSRTALLDLNRGDWFTRVTSVTQKVQWCYDPYPVQGKKESKKQKADIYFHIYFDQRIAQEATNNMRDVIFSIQRKLAEGEILDDFEQKLFEEVFETDPQTNSLLINNSKLQKKVDYKGYRVLITDKPIDAQKAWIAYQERWVVEDTFKTLKSRLGCARLRNSDNRAMDGKILVQFVATAISMMVRRRIRYYANSKEVKGGKLQVVYESDGKILGLLNNITQTKFCGGFYFSEIAGKRKKYFDALGVPVPDAQPEEPPDYDDDSEPTRSQVVV